MNNIGTIIAMGVLVMMSAYFSATETAFNSLNVTKLKISAEKGDKGAILMLRLVEDYNRLLTTILVGNNIVNIALSAMATVFFIELVGDAGATLSTAVITVVVLIFGEITPKSVAKESPEAFARFSAPIINFLAVILTPINYLFGLWKKLISIIFKSSDEQAVTEEELLSMVDEVEHSGGIGEQEGELIRNAMELNENDCADIATPRVDIEAVEKNWTKEMENIADTMLTKPVFVPKTMKIGALLKLLQKNKCHMAVVTDEYGGTYGIVTMEDILEELVGEIWDEHDEVEEDISENKGVYTVSGSMEPEELFEELEMDIEEVPYATLSGWIMDELNKVPEVGDTFENSGYRFTVETVDGMRVDTALVEKLEPLSEAEEE